VDARARFQVTTATDRLDVLLHFERGVTLEGTVRSSDGPVAGAELIATWCCEEGLSRSSVSDAAGRFRVEDVSPKHADVTALHPRYGVASAEVPDGITNVDIAFDETSRRTGTVSSAEGPVAGARIEEHIDGPKRRLLRATTDGEGRFSLDIASDRVPILSAPAPGYVEAATLAMGERIDFVLERGRPLFGTVYGDDGQPVPFAELSAAVASRMRRPARAARARFASTRSTARAPSPCRIPTIRRWGSRSRIRPASATTDSSPAHGSSWRSSTTRIDLPPTSGTTSTDPRNAAAAIRTHEGARRS
jgi:hypothetical protein